MKSLKQLCVPRASVFDKSRRDVVLDITDLAENKIDPDDFFAENCVVISDLRTNYTQGTRLINEALGNLEDEINRSALNLEPVGMNTDEIYHVLRKRLFESQPSKDDVREVAQAYAQAVKDAKQMDITSASRENRLFFKNVQNLKEDMVAKGVWREEFGHVEKPPFPQPDTSVRIQEISRDDDTGAAQLKIMPIHGDQLYFEVGAPATTASQMVENPKQFVTKELEVSFLCVESKGEHNTGDPVSWRNRITLKHRTWQDGDKKMAELRAAPMEPIRYTTDGSNPKTSGGLYISPFEIPRNAPMILAIAEKRGIQSDVLHLPITWGARDEPKIDPATPVAWMRKHKRDTTQATFELIERLKKYQAQTGSRLVVAGDDRNWIELTMDERFALDALRLETTISQLRSLLPSGQVALEADRVIFSRGQDLLDWVADAKLELRLRDLRF